MNKRVGKLHSWDDRLKLGIIRTVNGTYKVLDKEWMGWTDRQRSGQAVEFIPGPVYATEVRPI